MKKIIENIFTLILAIIGVIGGTFWGLKTSWDYEPTILLTASCIQVIAFIVVRYMDAKDDQLQPLPFEGVSRGGKNLLEQNVNVNVTYPQNTGIPLSTAFSSGDVQSQLSRDEIIEIMKSRVQILFIDDDKKFNIVQNLKDGGWKLTKTVEDIKNVDVPIIKKSQILFVDINGVGKILNLEYEGLDLALMLKQKYADKKIIIYSANKNSNSFHQAWTLCDYRLEKNALPYQFQSLVESYSIELYKKEK